MDDLKLYIGLYGFVWKNVYQWQTTGRVTNYILAFSGRALVSSQRSQGRYKWDFQKSLCTGRERIRTGNYAFIDVLDGVAMAPKLEHAVERPYQVLI